MSAPQRVAVGIGLTLTGWLCTRASARAWTPRRWGAWLFDLAPPAVLFAVALGATGRPVLAGAAAGAALGGIAFADLAKRRFLGEPVVFTDLGVLPELFRHSELYLAFVGYGRVVGGFLAVVAAVALALVFEPPLPGWSPLVGLGAVLLAGVALAACVGPMAPLLAAGLRRFRVTGDPVRDSSELGLAGMQFIHGVVARADRPARVAALAPPQRAPSPRAGDAAPVILVQLESFFDVRRLHPALGDAPLSAWDRLAAEASAGGRLSVPGVGGATMRTEFTVLTGRDPAELGLDRLHPYRAFGGAPVDSLAWRLKAQGYRTVCLHPYDRRFYGRDRALPNLGFDVFLGEEAFAGAARGGRYVSDLAVADKIAEVVEAEGPAVFVFAITMGAHGPWELEPRRDLPGVPPAAVQGLGDYLGRLAETDGAVGRLERLLRARSDGVLALYGDHLPSLPALFSALRMNDLRTDALVWSPGAREGPAMAELGAHELADRVLAASRVAGAR